MSTSRIQAIIDCHQTERQLHDPGALVVGVIVCLVLSSVVLLSAGDWALVALFVGWGVTWIASGFRALVRDRVSGDG